MGECPWEGTPALLRGYLCYVCESLPSFLIYSLISSPHIFTHITVKRWTLRCIAFASREWTQEEREMQWFSLVELVVLPSLQSNTSSSPSFPRLGLYPHSLFSQVPADVAHCIKRVDVVLTRMGVNCLDLRWRRGAKTEGINWTTTALGKWKADVQTTELGARGVRLEDCKRIGVCEREVQ